MINLHRAFILIRSDIRSKSNVELLNILSLYIIKEKTDSDVVELLKSSAIISDEKINFILDTEGVYECGSAESAILFDAINELAALLKTEQYDEAYALADTIHVFPEIMGSKESLQNYWENYVISFKNEWGNGCFDEYEDYFNS